MWIEFAWLQSLSILVYVSTHTWVDGALRRASVWSINQCPPNARVCAQHYFTTTALHHHRCVACVKLFKYYGFMWKHVTLRSYLGVYRGTTARNPCAALTIHSLNVYNLVTPLSGGALSATEKQKQPQRRHQTFRGRTHTRTWKCYTTSWASCC